MITSLRVRMDSGHTDRVRNDACRAQNHLGDRNGNALILLRQRRKDRQARPISGAFPASLPEKREAMVR